MCAIGTPARKDTDIRDRLMIRQIFETDGLNAKNCVDLIEGRRRPPLLPGWDHVRAIANNPISRYSSLVPIIGYLVLLSEKVRDYLSSEIYSAMFLNVEQKMLALYWAFIFVFCGNIIFLLRKPLYLDGKSEGDFVVYEAQKNSIIDIQNISKWIMRDLEDYGYYDNGNFVRSQLSLDDQDEPYLADILSAVGSAQFLNENPDQKIKQPENWQRALDKVLPYYYRRKNYGRKYSILFSLLFSYLGYTIIFTMSLDTLWGVIEYTINRVQGW